MSIALLSNGLMTTVQDLGRFGCQAQGVPVSGAMDTRAASMGNVLVGNPLHAAVVEMAFAGADLEFQKSMAIAVTGADFSPALNGQEIETYRTYYVRAGDRLRFGAVKGGNYSYVAVSGGIEVPVVMGSRSTYVRAALGGFCGRRLKQGDCLPVGDHPYKLNNMHLRKGKPPRWGGNLTEIRVILGPQDDCFTEEGLTVFLSETYTITREQDRMGVRLEGAAVHHKTDGNIISDGVAFGSVQIPSHGKPIIMLADRQTVGGYAKIAGVCRSDLGKLVQLQPGQQLRFSAISLEQAHALSAARLQELQEWQAILSAPPRPRRFVVEVNGKTLEVELTE